MTEPPPSKLESTPGAVAMTSDGVDQAGKVSAVGIRASRARGRPSTLAASVPSQMATMPGAVNSTSAKHLLGDKKITSKSASMSLTSTAQPHLSASTNRRGLSNKKGVNDNRTHHYHSDDSSVESLSGIPRVRRGGKKKQQSRNTSSAYSDADTSGDESQPGFVRVKGRGLRRKTQKQQQQGDLTDTSGELSVESQISKDEDKDFSEQENHIPTNSVDNNIDFSEQEIHIPTNSFDNDFSEQEVHIPTNSMDQEHSEQDIVVGEPEIVMQTKNAVLETAAPEAPLVEANNGNEAKPGAVATVSADHKKNHAKSHFVSQGSSSFLGLGSGRGSASEHQRILQSSNTRNETEEPVPNVRRNEIEQQLEAEPGRQPEEEENPMYTPFPDGENHHTKGRRKHNQSVLLVVGVCVLVAIVIATVVTVVVVTMGGGEESDSSKETTTTAAPKAELDPSRIPGLTEATLEALADLNSPQRKAYDWVLEEDPIADQYEDWQLTQRFALATFFHAMGGPRWGSTTWLDYEANECQWLADPEACNEDGRVVMIKITQQRGFKGSLPPEMALLTQLFSMDFSNNIISDMMDLFGNNFTHPSLQAIWCSKCRLSGSFPVALARLPNLRGLILNDNDMTGLLPPEIGQMSLLMQLELQDNQFTGAIPEAIGNLQELQVLNLGGNDFTSLPSEVGMLTKMRSFSLDGNGLQQSIPSQIGSMGQLELLLLGTNSFQGTIPSELVGLTKVRQLHLSQNALSGTIPDMLGRLPALQWIGLSFNNFVGAIPSVLGQLTGLQILDLAGNSLTSTIPSELGRLVRLTQLEIFTNKLSGSIPSELGRLTGLEALDLINNALTVQEVPEEVCTNLRDKLITDWCRGSSCCAR